MPRAAIVCLLSATIAACAPAPSRDCPPGLPWEQAKALILTGKVKEIFESRGYILILTLKNGRMERTESTRLDEVLDVKNECGAPCADIPIGMD